MAKIKAIQATAIMDTIAKNICGVYGIVSMDEMTKKVNELTRKTFCDICSILDIEEIETE